MNALAKIRGAGFGIYLQNDILEITPADQLTLPQIDFLKSHKAEIIQALKTEARGNLSANDHERLLAYLAAIGETDQEVINDLIERCKASKEALSFWLSEAANALD